MMKKLVMGLIVFSLLALIATAPAIADAKQIDVIESSSNIVTFVVVDKDSISNTFTISMDNANKVSKVDEKTLSKKWDNVYPDIDLIREEEYSGTLIKETIIVNNNNIKTSFDFTVIEKGGTYIRQVGDTIEFVKKEGEYVLLNCPVPFAIDANGVRYEYRYKLLGNNKIRLSPAESLSEVVYPLTIDPSYTVQSDSVEGATNSHRSFTRLGDGSYATVYLRDFVNETVCVATSDDLITWQEIKTFPDFGNASHPSVATDRYSNLHIVWVGRYNDTRDDVYYAQYNGTWSTVDRVTSSLVPENFTAFYPALAVDSLDRVHIVSSARFEMFATPVDYFLYSNRDSDGDWQSNTLYTTWEVGANIAHEISMAVDDNDKIGVVFASTTGADPGHQHIKYVLSDSGGETWGSPESLSSGNFNNTQPTIAYDSNENALVAWAGYTNATWRSILFRQYLESSGNWTDEFNVSNGGYDRCEGLWQGNPSLSTSYNPSTGLETYWFTWNGYWSLYDNDELAILYRYKTVDGSWYTYTGSRVHVDESNATYPSALWATWPKKCGTSVNIPKTWQIFAYTLDETANVYTKPVEWNAFAGVDLTIRAIDANTGETIQNFVVTLSTGSSNTTTTGVAFFPCEPAGTSISISITSNGYYPSTGDYTVFTDSDKEVIIALLSITEEDYYQPSIRSVEFTVMSWWGHKYPGVLVNVTGYEISHPQTWLEILLGVNNETEIYNTSMNGTTDSGGAISFMMVETIKYRMTFQNATEGINEVWYKYPKDDHYIVMVSTTESPFLPGGDWYDDINFTANWTAINDTHAYINFYYNDSLNETFDLTFFINNTDTNETFVWNFTYSNNCNNSFNRTIVDHTGGASFFVGFNAEGHLTYGVFGSEYVIKFKDFLDVGLPLSACRMLSIALLFFMACFFGATSATKGAIIIHIPAWTFYYWGWLLIVDDATTIAVLSITLSISVLAFLTERSRRVLNN